MSETVTSHDIAARLGCSSRSACAVLRDIAGLPIRSMSPPVLRVPAADFESWLFAMRRRRPMRKAAPGRDLVYFVSDGTAVKIGRSLDVKRRVAQLQKANPRPVVLLGVFAGGAAAEAYFHGAFRLSRIHGEWFRLELPDLIGLGLAKVAA